MTLLVVCANLTRISNVKHDFVQVHGLNVMGSDDDHHHHHHHHSDNNDPETQSVQHTPISN